MPTLHIVYLGAMSLLALLTMIAIFSHAFPDNVLQRVGLSMVCFGAIFRVLEFWHDPDSVLTPPSTLIALGACVFALGTAWKMWKFNRECKRTNERRNNTMRFP